MTMLAYILVRNVVASCYLLVQLFDVGEPGDDASGRPMSQLAMERQLGSVRLLRVHFRLLLLLLLLLPLDFASGKLLLLRRGCCCSCLWRRWGLALVPPTEEG